MKKKDKKLAENKKAKELSKFEKTTLRLMKIQTILIVLQVLIALIGMWI